MDQATEDAIARARGTTGVCFLCDTAVQQVPARDEWAWANDAGTTGLPGDLVRDITPAPRSIEDVYAALAWLAEHNVRQYVSLKVRLDLGGASHQHQVHAGDEQAPGPAGPLPWHCAWPMRLTPSGWACRQCGWRQDEARTMPGQRLEASRA